MRIPKPYILIFIFAFASCKITENNISGKYSDYFNFENNAELTLNQDKTFDYIFQSGMIFTYEGKWRLSEDTLILYSNSKPVSPKFVITQLSVSNDALLKIFVSDELNTPVPFHYYFGTYKKKFSDTSIISYSFFQDTLSIYPFTFAPVLLNKIDIKPGVVQIKVFRDPDDYFEDMKFLVRNGKLKKIVGQKRTGFFLKSAANQ